MHDAEFSNMFNGELITKFPHITDYIRYWIDPVLLFCRIAFAKYADWGYTFLKMMKKLQPANHQKSLCRGMFSNKVAHKFVNVASIETLLHRALLTIFRAGIRLSRMFFHQHSLRLGNT